tara:strand:- start:47 stop:829 length:783 start_codon:yes stop_codon:yes gene_type:complete
MKYSDIRIVENEKEFTALVITTNGTKIDIPNIPKSYISSKARLKTAIDKLIARYNSNKGTTFSVKEIKIVDDTGKSVNVPTTSANDVTPSSGGGFQASDEEKEAMQNVLNLHRLIMNTMKDTIWKGLKNNTNDNIDKGLYYLPRQNDPEFPTGVSFEYTVGGKKFKINDIKEEIGIDLVVNTKNPKKDKYGYTHAEGWPVYMNEWDDMKQITIDAVNAREHISTVGPPAPEQKVDGPLRIAISPKTFYYRNATVVDTDNN